MIDTSLGKSSMMVTCSCRHIPVNGMNKLRNLGEVANILVLPSVVMNIHHKVKSKSSLSEQGNNKINQVKPQKSHHITPKSNLDMDQSCLPLRQFIYHSRMPYTHELQESTPKIRKKGESWP